MNKEQQVKESLFGEDIPKLKEQIEREIMVEFRKTYAKNGDRFIAGGLAELLLKRRIAAEQKNPSEFGITGFAVIGFLHMHNELVKSIAGN